MKKSPKRKAATSKQSAAKAIVDYEKSQTPKFGRICKELRALIEETIPKAPSKVWHGSPVWFDGDNPIVGYNATAKSVNLLFWNGQAFKEPALKPVGKYGAAQASFQEAAELEPKVIRGWLRKAKANVFDSVSFFKKIRERKKSGRQSN